MVHFVNLLCRRSRSRWAGPRRQLQAHPYSCPKYLHWEGQGSPVASICFYDVMLHHNVWPQLPHSQATSAA